jgi:hypothetical protein
LPHKKQADRWRAIESPQFFRPSRKNTGQGGAVGTAEAFLARSFVAIFRTQNGLKE